MLIDQARAKTTGPFHSILEQLALVVTTIETVSASSLFLALSTCFEPETVYCRRLGEKKNCRGGPCAPMASPSHRSNIDGQTETRHVFASKDTTRGMPTGTILGIVVHLHWPGLKSFSDLNLETAMRLTSPEISEYDTRRVTRKKKLFFRASMA